MHGAEMSVAAEHGLDVLFVVFNNRSHGRVRLGQLQEPEQNARIHGGIGCSNVCAAAADAVG